MTEKSAYRNTFLWIINHSWEKKKNLPALHISSSYGRAALIRAVQQEAVLGTCETCFGNCMMRNALAPEHG